MTSIPEFMSEEHVQKMNRILAEDDSSISACAALPKDYLIVYAIEKDEGYVYWQLLFDTKTGIRFTLGEPSDKCDLILRSEWTAYIDAERKRRLGASVNPFKAEGNEEVLTIVKDAFSAGAKAATVNTRLPDV